MCKMFRLKLSCNKEVGNMLMVLDDQEMGRCNIEVSMVIESFEKRFVVRIYMDVFFVDE